MASFSLANCLEEVPVAIRLWKPEHAPHATVMNSIGNRVCPALGSQLVKAGISKATVPVKAPATTPMNARPIIAYSRKLDR